MSEPRPTWNPEDPPAWSGGKPLPPPAPMPAMSPDDLNRIARAVVQTGRNRARSLPAMNDGDYLAGAVAAMQAMGASMDQMPKDWLLMIFTGQSPLR